MAQLTGAGSAAHLAHAVILQLHRTRPDDLEDTEFPPPLGRVAVALCTVGGKRSTRNCGETLTERIGPNEMPEADDAAVARSPRDGGRIAFSLHRAWAREKGFPIAESPTSPGAVRLTIAAPADNSHFWRNPETPPALDRLPLKAVVEPLTTNPSRSPAPIRRYCGRSDQAPIISSSDYRCRTEPRRRPGSWWSDARSALRCTPSDQPVEPGHDQRVAGPQSADRLRQLRPIGPGPDAVSWKITSALAASKPSTCLSRVCPLRRDPGVAEQTYHECPLISYIESEADRGAPVRDRLEWANRAPPQGRDRPPWPAPAPMAAPRCAAGRGGVWPCEQRSCEEFRWLPVRGASDVLPLRVATTADAGPRPQRRLAGRGYLPGRLMPRSIRCSSSWTA
jgi:hypothetical protein